MIAAHTLGVRLQTDTEWSLHSFRCLNERKLSWLNEEKDSDIEEQEISKIRYAELISIKVLDFSMEVTKLPEEKS